MIGHLNENEPLSGVAELVESGFFVVSIGDRGCDNVTGGRERKGLSGVTDLSLRFPISSRDLPFRSTFVFPLLPRCVDSPAPLWMGEEFVDAAVTEISGTGTSRCCPGPSSPIAMSGIAVEAVSSPPRD